MPTVSVVIVCMNNLKNLYPCLDSIKAQTSLEYETLVVAYLFSKENLEKLVRDYSWVSVIDSNEIRGFSENNNLALRRAKGEFCFVLNDDTNFDMPIIDRLVEDMTRQADATVMSPKIMNADGSVFCGRPPVRFLEKILEFTHLRYVSAADKKYINGRGIFQTYNITGCSFLIRTDVFRQLGFFNEAYFFCPEDIELSEILNTRGCKCYVNADVVLHHHHASTLKQTSIATFPAMVVGILNFYSGGSKFMSIFWRVFTFPKFIFLIFVWTTLILKDSRRSMINIRRYFNAIAALFSQKSPKGIFIQYYKPPHVLKRQL